MQFSEFWALQLHRIEGFYAFRMFFFISLSHSFFHLLFARVFPFTVGIAITFHILYTKVNKLLEARHEHMNADTAAENKTKMNETIEKEHLNVSHFIEFYYSKLACSSICICRFCKRDVCVKYDGILLWLVDSKKCYVWIFIWIEKSEQNTNVGSNKFCTAFFFLSRLKMFHFQNNLNRSLPIHMSDFLFTLFICFLVWFWISLSKYHVQRH